MDKVFILAGILIVGAMSVSADNCGGAVQCHCGDTLIQSHTMWYNLDSCLGNGLTVGRDNLKLDCVNHTISKLSSDFSGIEISVQETSGYDRLNWRVNASIEDIRLLTMDHLALFLDGIQIPYSFKTMQTDGDYITRLDIFFLANISSGQRNTYVLKYCDACENNFHGPNADMMALNQTGLPSEYNSWRIQSDGYSSYYYSPNSGNPGEYWALTSPPQPYGTEGGWWTTINVTNSILKYSVDTQEIQYGTGYSALRFKIFKGSNLQGPMIIFNEVNHAHAWTTQFIGATTEANIGENTLYLDAYDATNSGGFDYGSGYDNIRIQEAFDGEVTIRNLTPQNSGLLVNNTNGLNVSRCNLKGFDYGLYLQNSENIKVSKSNFSKNSYGAYLVDENLGVDNYFWGNAFTDNNYNAYEDENVEQVNWNLGLVGNYWSDYEINPGYPEYYKIWGWGDGIDWHPNQNNSNLPDTHTCGGDVPCRCGDTLVSSTTLSYNITGCQYAGLYLNSNMILDCDGNSISGTNYYLSRGLDSNGQHNFVVKNCQISNFDYGTFFNDTHNDYLLNNKFVNNYREGMRVQYSDHSTIANNIVSNNVDYGIVISKVYSSNVSFNYVSGSNPFGIYVDDSQNNVIESNVVASNNGGFLFWRDTTQNIVSNNVVRNSQDKGIYLNTGVHDNLFYENNLSSNRINAYEEQNVWNNWNISGIGNLWDDFNSNPGYPNFYEIPGPGDGIDWYPAWNFSLIDYDHDGIIGHEDNCPWVYNPDQIDTDGDGYGDICDACDFHDPGLLFCDDFTGGIFTQWIEGQNTFDQHFVDERLWNYHTQQLTANDRSIILYLNRTMDPEDIIDYVVEYVNGTGNVEHKPRIDGRELDLYGLDCHGFATCGDIGYWNGESEVGNIFGNYKVHILYEQDRAIATFTNPLGDIFTYVANLQSGPHTFGIESRTGHEGIGHFDYDNVSIRKKIQTNEPPVVDPIQPITAIETDLIRVNISASDPDNDLINISFYLPFDQIGQWQTGYNDAGVYQFHAVVSDGYNIVQAPFNVTVFNLNLPPNFDFIPDQQGAEGQNLTFNLPASDPDNDQLNFTMEPTLQGAKIMGNTFSWLPGYYDAGVYNVTFTVTDAFGAQDSKNAVITIENTPYTDLQLLDSDISFYDDNPLKKTADTITVVFRNLLEISPPTILVRFYNDVPGNETLIGESVVDNTREDMYVTQIDWTPQKEGDYPIHVWVDPLNNIPEADETNNIAVKHLVVRTKPDIKIRNQDVYFSGNQPRNGDNITLYAQVRNIENISTGRFTVRFYDGNWNNVIGEKNLSLIPLQNWVVNVTWRATIGTHEINVFGDSSHIIDEMNETNNLGKKNITVSPPSGSPIFTKPVYIRQAGVE